MNHETIEEKGFIEGYHQGNLAPEEEVLFEEHLMSCRQCQEELEMARGFRLGMRALAAQEAARRVAEGGVLAWLVRRSRRGQGALLFGFLLALVVLPSTWFALENRQLHRAVEAEKVEPLSNTPVFILSTLRDAGQPTPSLSLDPREDWLTLAVDVDSDPGIESYRVTVLEAEGERLWRRDGLLPNDLEVLMVTFPASFFMAGEYRLVVAGQGMGDEAVPIESFTFRIAGEVRSAN